jgi:hypothetical protein
MHASYDSRALRRAEELFAEVAPICAEAKRTQFRRACRQHAERMIADFDIDPIAAEMLHRSKPDRSWRITLRFLQRRAYRSQKAYEAMLRKAA